MGQAIFFKLKGNSPSPDWPKRVKHAAVIGARSSLQTWQDPSLPSYFTFDGNNASRWNSRVGASYYEQANAANRPERRTGAGSQNGVPFLLFDGSAKRMAPNGVPNLNPANAFSVVVMAKPSLYDTNRYLFGTSTANDNLYVFAHPSGQIRFAMGNGTLSRAHTIDTWAPVLVTWNGSTAKRARLFIDGAMSEATVGIAPTTARALSMGATSTQVNPGLWNGGIADWLYFTEDVSNDTTFLSVLSQYFRNKYALPYEPFVVG